MDTITKDVIIETMQSNQAITEKAETIVGQMVWLDGLTKETVAEALILVMQQSANIDQDKVKRVDPDDITLHYGAAE